MTAQVGSTWKEYFRTLELHHGLDINNANHIWLLHFLFLEPLNENLAFFAESWNNHQMQIRHGRNRSPADMFGFDMLALGVRGQQLPMEMNMSQEELELYGVDWEGLEDEQTLESREANNLEESGFGSWIGRTGPPEALSGVELEEPLNGEELETVVDLEERLTELLDRVDRFDVYNVWHQALVLSRSIHADLF